MFASWAPNTVKTYGSALKKWAAFCIKEEIDPTTPGVQDIVNFIQSLASTDLGVNSISTHRAALTTFLSGRGLQSLSDAEPFLTRMIKGIMRIKPTNPKSAEIWDVEEALQWIRKMWPLEELNLKLLTWRTLLLASLCSPKRANELASLSLLELRQSSNVWKFTLVKTKNRGYGAPHAAVYQKFEDEILCPITSFSAYLEATSAVRKDKEIFLSYMKPHNKVTSATIARWLKNALAEAGIKGFSAHSTRAASTSKAAAKGLSPKAILEAANWSPKSSTFQRFYNKDIDESYQEMILGKSRSDYGNDRNAKKPYNRYDVKRQTEGVRRRGTNSTSTAAKKRLEKEFDLSLVKVYEFLKNDYGENGKEDAFKDVYELAEKRVLIKQQKSPDPNFNLIDAIKNELSEILPNIKYYHMSKNFLMEFVAAKKIITEEQANHVFDICVVVKSNNTSIMGIFEDNYGIMDLCKYHTRWFLYRQNTRKLRWPHNFKLIVSSTPSTVTKMKGVNWYLCMESDRCLYVKHRTLIDRNDYLIAEMKSNSEEEFMFDEYSYIEMSIRYQNI